MYKVTFLPEEVQVKVEQGTSLMQAAAEAGIQMEGPCGGKGTCSKCRVDVREANGEQTVLACQTPVNQDMIVTIPQNEVSLFRKGEADRQAMGLDIEINPAIWKKALKVEKPKLENQHSDLARFYEAFGKEIPLTYTALQDLPAALRTGDHQITAVFTDERVLSVETGDNEGQLYGLAVDIGTTTVVAALMDLVTGHVLGIASITNSQNIFGADVISRIEHVVNYPQGLEQLQKRIVQGLNNLIDKLCAQAKVKPVDIGKLTIAGNTTMEHLFLGIDPRNLGPAPFIPVITHPLKLEAREIGLKTNPHAIVNMIPNIAGYVGGDITAVVLATRIYEKSGIFLAIDIGTNGEMVLSVDGKMMSCSTAAGPAFEGAHIKYGMRAAPGAIEGVGFDGDISLKVIGDGYPTGVCGSGLIQAVQVLVSIGAVTSSGKMLSRKEGENKGLAASILDRFGTDENGNFFILAYPRDKSGGVVITQMDIRELQLAKGAIRTGIEILLKEAGITAGKIDQVLMAGAFGNYINIESALALGLLPKVAYEKIIPVGNAAGTGARIALISEELWHKAAWISREVKHIELSGRIDFHEMFIQNLSLSD
jgi:uncharacterized 2Fe-2S/4Fe-4S cluster protein (DUF4445 family)